MNVWELANREVSGAARAESFDFETNSPDVDAQMLHRISRDATALYNKPSQDVLSANMLLAESFCFQIG